jgi:hypothetical protein
MNEVTGARLGAENNIEESPNRIMRIKSEAGVTEGNVPYCHIKMMNTSREYIQLGKNVKIGTAKDLHEGMKDVHR